MSELGVGIPADSEETGGLDFISALDASAVGDTCGAAATNMIRVPGGPKTSIQQLHPTAATLPTNMIPVPPLKSPNVPLVILPSEPNQ